ncbi:MAG: hypothetical protein D6767_11045, partial [Candidatus Hydrogenedentota bacterium]
ILKRFCRVENCKFSMLNERIINVLPSSPEHALSHILKQSISYFHVNGTLEDSINRIAKITPLYFYFFSMSGRNNTHYDRRVNLTLRNRKVVDLLNEIAIQTNTCWGIVPINREGTEYLVDFRICP